MKLILAVFIILFSESVFSQTHKTFKDFLTSYKAAPISARSQIANEYFSARRSAGGFPVIDDDGTVTFIYQPAKTHDSVQVIGDFKTEYFYSYGWDLNGQQLQPLAPDSDILIAQIKVETDARFDYLFVVNGKRVLDPLNPQTYFNGPIDQLSSQLIMPKYPFIGESKDLPREARGKIVRLTLDWLKAPVSVYLPAGYDSSKKYPVIYTADGKAWDKFMTLPKFLDEMIADRRISPVLAVMMDSIEDRRNWYLFNPDYINYLERIVAHIDREFSTKPKPMHRYHFGTSAGGRAAIYAALERPDLFLNVAMLSPSLTGSLTYFESYFSQKKRPNSKLNVWLSAGTYEGYLHQDTKTLETFFKKHGLKVKSVYTHEGHSFQNWRHRTPEALDSFFALKKVK